MLSAQSGLSPCWTSNLGESIRTVAWLPSHQAVLALTASGGLVQLLAADGQPGWGYGLPGTGAICMAVCPCGWVVASGHLNGSLRLRQTATGHALHTVVLGPGWVEHVRWSPDGQWLAASSGRVLHLLDGTGRRLGSYPHPEVLDELHWQPASDGLAASSGSTVHLWELNPTTATLVAGPALPAGPPISNLAWAPDGRRLAIGLPKGRVGGWRLPAGRPLTTRRLAGSGQPVAALSWNPRGQWLATAQGPAVAVWEAAAMQLSPRPIQLRGHQQPVGHLAWQPCGSLLASADTGGTLALWQPGVSSAPLVTYSLSSAATTLHWMANGCCLTVGTATGQVLLFRALQQG